MDGAGERMEIEMSSDSQTTLPDFVCSAGTGCYAPKICIKNIRYYVLEDIARLYTPGIFMAYLICLACLHIVYLDISYT